MKSLEQIHNETQRQGAETGAWVHAQLNKNAQDFDRMNNLSAQRIDGDRAREFQRQMQLDQFAQQNRQAGFQAEMQRQQAQHAAEMQRAQMEHERRMKQMEIDVMRNQWRR